jgi:Ca2+:H+ antiporter
MWTDSFCSFTVILGWILSKPLTLLFDPFESIVLFLSGGTFLLSLRSVHRLRFGTVLTVNYVVQDGKSNWLEGMILICAPSSQVALSFSVTNKCVV